MPKRIPGSLSTVRKKQIGQKISNENSKLGNSIMTIRSCVPDRVLHRRNSIEKDYLANLTRRADRVGRVDPLVFATKNNNKKMRSVLSTGYGSRQERSHNPYGSISNVAASVEYTNFNKLSASLQQRLMQYESKSKHS